MKKQKKKEGRPTEFKEEYCEQVEKLCLLSATDQDIADFFNVSKQTIYNWKEKHQEFLDSLKKGKDLADQRVVKRLYQRAIGYEHAEDKIFQNNGVPVIVPTIRRYPPETVACIFWLKNRRPNEWRDRQDIDLNVTDKKDLSNYTDEELRSALKLKQKQDAVCQQPDK